MKSYRTNEEIRLRAEAELPAIAEKIASLADRPIRKTSLTITPPHAHLGSSLPSIVAYGRLNVVRPWTTRVESVGNRAFCFVWPCYNLTLWNPATAARYTFFLALNCAQARR